MGHSNVAGDRAYMWRAYMWRSELWKLGSGGERKDL
jgi:hypothetical protein